MVSFVCLGIQRAVGHYPKLARCAGVACWVSGKTPTETPPDHIVVQVCWISTEAAPELGIWIWILFFVPTVAYFIFSIMVAVLSIYRFRTGLARTQEIRRKVLRDGVWTFVLLIFCSVAARYIL